LRDGPDDKLTFFVTVSEVPDEVTIPKIESSARGDLPAFTMLEGHRLHELLTTEYRAIARVLTNRRRPHLTLQLDRLDERALGALMFSLCVLTALTGTLMGVDPFDQPGVEEGKVYIREMLA
jgi:glucose-6-phosphate isomerase